MKSFLHAYYQKPVPNFCAIIASSDQWLYYIGTVPEFSSSFAGPYAVAGSGSQLFRDMVDRMSPRTESVVAGDLDGLRIANDFMAREAITGEPIQALFGGAYEVLYHGQKGLERVDDVMHFFTTVNVTTKNIDISPSQFPARQWYEGDQMLIASFSTPEAHQQGLEFKAFGIPSVLKEMAGSIRTYEWLVSQPKYLCIHHLFKIEGQRFPSVMTMRGTAFDEMFRISRTENKWEFEPTDAYKERVRLEAQVVVRDNFATRS